MWLKRPELTMKCVVDGNFIKDVAITFFLYSYAVTHVHTNRLKDVVS